MKYRPDVDGLRAFAVIAVMLCHFNQKWLPSGFIGVDIFFVISGYIITKGIYPKILTNTFSYKEFYTKRVKRILPLFYLVALVTTIFAYLLYTPNDFVDMANSMRYASAFIANLYFARHSGYFAPTSETLPLLHTWSLSIEEQFYFIWPLLLIFGTRFLSKKSFLASLLLLLVGLVGYSQYLVISDATSAYYLIQSRGFELLLGTLLAILLQHKQEQEIHFPKKLYSLSALMGLVLLGYSFISLDANSIFPGINAFIVCFGVVLVILSGEEQSTFLSKFLGKPVNAFIGRLSYSMYLWHWPIIAFYRYYYLQTTTLGLFICALATLIISYCSWRFYESPLRFLKLKTKWVFLLYFIAPLVIAIMVAKNIVNHKGYPLRFNAKALEYYNYSQSHFESSGHKKLSNVAPLTPFVIGSQTRENIDAILWGDSHAGHFMPFIDELGKENGFSAMHVGTGDCPPVIGADVIKNGQPREKCHLLKEQAAALIEKSSAKYVFLAGRWAMYSEVKRSLGEKGDGVYLGEAATNYIASKENSRRALRYGLENSIKLIIKTGKIPVIFKQAPSYPFKPTNCWIRTASSDSKNNLACNLNYKNIKERFNYIDNLMDSLKQKYPQIILIPITSLLCRSGICMSKQNDIPLYRDNNHINAAGAREIFELYRKDLSYKVLEQNLKLNLQ